MLLFFSYITLWGGARSKNFRGSPARRSANVNARSAERGSCVESHLSGLSMLSIENEEELKSDSMIFKASWCFIGDGSEKSHWMLVVMTAVRKDVASCLYFSSLRIEEDFNDLSILISYIKERADLVQKMGLLNSFLSYSKSLGST